MCFVCFHCKQINHSFECILCSDWKLHCYCIRTQSILHHIYNSKEVCSNDIHFVYESNSWYFVCVCLSPYIFRLRFYPAFCTEYSYSTVQYTKRTLYFYCKVNVARSINDIDTVIVPLSSCRSRSNGNTSLFFLLHPVHLRSSFVSFS